MRGLGCQIHKAPVNHFSISYLLKNSHLPDPFLFLLKAANINHQCLIMRRSIVKLITSTSVVWSVKIQFQVLNVVNIDITPTPLEAFSRRGVGCMPSPENMFPRYATITYTIIHIVDSIELFDLDFGPLTFKS